MHFIINDRKNYKFHIAFSVFLLFSVLFAGHLFSEASEKDSHSELILLWNTSLSAAEAESYLAEHYPELSLTEHDADYSLCLVAENASSRSLLKQLNNDSMLLLAEPDYEMELMALPLPDDPYIDSLWAFENMGFFTHYYGTLKISQPSTARMDMNIWKAWEYYPLEKEATNTVIVAVIDTGIDYRHPDLKDAMWINKGEIAGNMLDDDGNGYIDDIYGWDFYHDDNTVCHYIDTEFGYAADPDDNDNHGTHCAGIIAATANNSIGIAGVAGNVNAQLMSLKIHGGITSSGSVSNAIRAIRYAEKMGADICNISWGTHNYSEALELVIKGSSMLFVTAAGNNGGNNNSTPVFPANLRLPNLISVAFIDYNGVLDPSSNYGVSTVDIAAPGKDIYSTMVGTYGYASGSSMAAPHVTGLAAMIYASQDKLYPAQIKELIINTMQPLETLNGSVINPGIPNASLAIQSLDLLVPDNTPPLLSIRTSFEQDSIRLSASGYDTGGSGVKEIRYVYGSKTLEDFQDEKDSRSLTGFSVLLTKPGYYTFYVEDYAGNGSVYVYYVEEDITAPELTASYAVSDDGSLFHVSISAKDSESGVKTVKYLIGEHTVSAFLSGGDVLPAYLEEYTIDISSEVTALTIYLSDHRGNATAYTIYPKIVPARNVHLTVAERSLRLNEALQLNAYVFPSNTTDRLMYTSSDSSILVVDESGRITGVAEGTASVTARSSSGAEAVCHITVKGVLPEAETSAETESDAEPADTEYVDAGYTEAAGAT